MRRDNVKLRGLRQARQRSGLSISQLAELTGLRRDLITHLEHGKEDPQPYVLRRLVSVLGASTEDLLGGAGLDPAVAGYHPITEDRPDAVVSVR
jgi:transcriptional regulator with XRE-family HTH domain